MSARFVRLDTFTGKGAQTREVFVNVDAITVIKPGNYDNAEPYVVHVRTGTTTHAYRCMGHHDDLLAQIEGSAS